MDVTNNNAVIDLTAIKDALERAQYGIDLMVQNAREPSSWDEDLEKIEAQLEIVKSVLTKPVAEVVASPAASESAFDLNKHCEWAAMNAYLNTFDDAAPMQEIVDALNSGDDDELERLDIGVLEEFERDGSESVANMIESTYEILVNNITYAHGKLKEQEAANVVAQVPPAVGIDLEVSANLQETLRENTSQIKESFLDDVHNLCESIVEGDPQTITDRMLNVKNSLPVIMANRPDTRLDDSLALANTKSRFAVVKIDNLSTSAFKDVGVNVEIANILYGVAAEIECRTLDPVRLNLTDLRVPVVDTNGNLVGDFYVCEHEQFESIQKANYVGQVYVGVDMGKAVLSPGLADLVYVNQGKVSQAETNAYAVISELRVMGFQLENVNVPPGTSTFSMSTSSGSTLVLPPEGIVVTNKSTTVMNPNVGVSVGVIHNPQLEEKRIIVVVRGGVVSGVCSSDPKLSVEVLDYDNIDEANMTEDEKALSDEADRLNAVY